MKASLGKAPDDGSKLIEPFQICAEMLFLAANWVGG
jgi:hypothetical protein